MSSSIFTIIEIIFFITFIITPSKSVDEIVEVIINLANASNAHLNRAVPITLWFGSFVYEYELDTNSVTKEYITTVQDMTNLGASYCSNPKIMIENVRTDSIIINKIRVDTESGKWYEIRTRCVDDILLSYQPWLDDTENIDDFLEDDASCDSGKANTWFCIDNDLNDCAPSKQILYFDMSTVDTSATGVSWEDATALSQDEIDCTPSPTGNPTKKPTPQTTTKPTMKPTHEATPAPTAQPTAVPTHQHSPAPTEMPTSEPTVRLSTTSYPTKPSSKNPTISLTLSPTKYPTQNPTVSISHTSYTSAINPITNTTYIKKEESTSFTVVWMIISYIITCFLIMVILILIPFIILFIMAARRKRAMKRLFKVGPSSKKEEVPETSVDRDKNHINGKNDALSAPKLTISVPHSSAFKKKSVNVLDALPAPVLEIEHDTAGYQGDPSESEGSSDTVPGSLNTKANTTITNEIIGEIDADKHANDEKENDVGLEYEHETTGGMVDKCVDILVNDASDNDTNDDEGETDDDVADDIGFFLETTK